MLYLLAALLVGVLVLCFCCCCCCRPTLVKQSHTCPCFRPVRAAYTSFPKLYAMPKILEQWRRPYTAGPLTEDEFEQYWNHGYVVKQGCLQQHDLQPSLDAIDRYV